MRWTSTRSETTKTAPPGTGKASLTTQFAFRAGFDYIFPVPVADIGDATVQTTDKVIVFMRYIRKALEDGTFGRSSCSGRRSVSP